MTEHHYHQEQGDPGPGYRSRAEVRIAGLLDQEGIAYRYEHPLAVVDQGRVRIWYPDFYLPEYGMILEHFGVNGDVGYDRRTEHKMRVYETTGVEGVFLNEDVLRRHGPTGITRQIEEVLQQRLRRFYSRPAQLRESGGSDSQSGLRKSSTICGVTPTKCTTSRMTPPMQGRTSSCRRD